MAGKGPRLKKKPKKEKPKIEKEIPLKTIKPENVMKTLEKGYDAVVGAVLADLDKMASEYENKIKAETKKGKWKKAQALIDNAPLFFKIDNDGNVSIADLAGIKKLLNANKKKFVEEVDRIVKTNITTEITTVSISWDFEFKGGTKEQNVMTGKLAELLVKNFNGELGINVPKGIKPGTSADEIPKKKKIKFADATVIKGKLPVYATQTNRKVTILWPGWIEPRPKEELFAVVPRKRRKKLS